MRQCGFAAPNHFGTLPHPLRKDSSTMAKLVQFDRIGGPEVLTLRDVEVGAPGAGELRIRVDAIGLNRAEVMFREGGYF